MEKELDIGSQDQEQSRGLQAVLDPEGLYAERIVTDRKIGTIRILKPVTVEGADDPGRPTLFAGECQIMTQMGALPISFDIPATTLAEAVAAFPDAARAGLERTVREIQEMRRQAASQIVLPGQQGFQVPPEGGSGLAMP